MADEPANYHHSVKEMKRTIVQALQQAHGSYLEAAKMLGIHPGSLLRLMRNLNAKARRSSCLQNRLRQIFRQDHTARSRHHRACDCVFELPRIPRPIVFDEASLRLLRQFLHPRLALPAGLRQKVVPPSHTRALPRARQRQSAGDSFSLPTSLFIKLCGFRVPPLKQLALSRALTNQWVEAIGPSGVSAYFPFCARHVSAYFSTAASC
jgi:hypothetical protein